MDLSAFGPCFLAVAVALLFLNLINYFANSLLVSSLILVVIAVLVLFVTAGGIGNLEGLGRRGRD